MEVNKKKKKKGTQLVVVSHVNFGAEPITRQENHKMIWNKRDSLKVFIFTWWLFQNRLLT